VRYLFLKYITNCLRRLINKNRILRFPSALVNSFFKF
jgi:hypothetical protein